MIDEATKAYLAGVIDLVGLIRLRGAVRGPLPIVQIHGHYLQTLSLFAELTDTKVIPTHRDYAKAGCSEHCADRHQHIVSTSARWSVTGAKATVLLINIHPYLRQKRWIADIVIDAGVNAGYKPATLRKMINLGWDVPEIERRAS